MAGPFVLEGRSGGCCWVRRSSVKADVMIERGVRMRGMIPLLRAEVGGAGTQGKERASIRVLLAVAGLQALGAGVRGEFGKGHHLGHHLVSGVPLGRGIHIYCTVGMSF